MILDVLRKAIEKNLFLVEENKVKYHTMNYLGVDYGTKRVGIAFSQGQIASPLATITFRNLDHLADQIQALAQQHRAETIVVGYPEGDNRSAVDGVIRRLKEKNLNIKTVDETLTTWQVYQDASRVNIKAGKVRLTVDSQAAANILQTYLDGKS